MVLGDLDTLIVKLASFIGLLAVLILLVSRFPYLWELGLAGILGGIYWIFFRRPE